jgi:hypothetical protein
VFVRTEDDGPLTVFISCFAVEGEPRSPTAGPSTDEEKGTFSHREDNGVLDEREEAKEKASA